MRTMKAIHFLLLSQQIGVPVGIHTDLIFPKWTTTLVVALTYVFTNTNDAFLDRNFIE